jgi:hypothetical protein
MLRFWRFVVTGPSSETKQPSLVREGGLVLSAGAALLTTVPAPTGLWAEPASA